MAEKSLYRYCRVFFFLNLLIVTGFSVQVSYSQYENLKSLQYGEADGLSSNNVNCIIQDPEGFIWVGTNNGLNRFDGYTFRNYMHDSKDSTSVIHNYILCFYISENSDLYIGTQSGVSMYNRQTDQFTQYRNLEGHYIRRIYEVEGTIYAVNDLSQVFRLDGNSFVLHMDYEQYNHYVMWDPEGYIWLAITGGVVKIDAESDTKTFYSVRASGIQTHKDLTVYCLMEDEGKIWMGTQTDGLFYLDKSTNEVKAFHHKLNFVKALNKDNKGNILIGDTYNLKIYNKKNKSLLEHDPLVDKRINQITAHAVDVIYPDQQGNLWLGVIFRGINLAFNDKGFNHIEYTSHDKLNRTKKTILSIAASSREEIWVGAFTNGLEKINLLDHSSKYYTCNRIGDGLQCGSVYKLYQTDDSLIWIGSYFGGLQELDPRTDKIRTIYPGATTGNPLSSTDIRSISRDKEGNYWILSHGTGVYKWDPRTDSLRLFNDNAEDPEQQVSSWSFHLLCDSKGNIWVCSPTGAFLSTDGETFTQFTHDPYDHRSLPTNEVFTAFEDSNHDIWLGTREGVCKFNPEDNNFQCVTKKNGLSDNYICSILEDDHKNLWIATKKGLSKYNLPNGQITSYNEGDGLQNNEFMENSAAKLPSGHLIFGSVNRGTWFHPDSLKINTKKPSVYLTNLKIFYESVPVEPNNKKAILQKPLRYTKEIVLNHDQKVISFSFVALNYIHPENNKYTYKLEGFDEEWIELDQNREVTYTNLTPGKYTFRVKAANNDGIWNMEGASLDVVILPPFWQTWWFRILMILVVLGIFMLIYFVRINTIRLANINLEKTVDERTQELQSKNEILAKKTHELDESNKLLEEGQDLIIQQSTELKDKNEQLEKINQQLRELNALKDRFFSIIGHDLRNPVNVIKGFVELLEEGFDELDDERKLFYLSHISVTIEKTSKLLDNLLNWAKTQSGTLKLQPENVNIHLLVKNALSFFKVEAGKKSITFNTKLDDRHLFAYADINMVETIIRNLISNAIKFSPAGSNIIIGCKPKLKEKEVLIWVEDKGKGIPPEQLDKLFRSETNISTHGTEGETGTGLGLILCREFVEKNGGKIWVESEVEKGSVFYFTLPFGPSTGSGTDML